MSRSPMVPNSSNPGSLSRPEIVSDTYFDRVRRLGKEIYKWRRSYLFLTPFLIVFFMFVVLPVIQSMYYSLTYFNGLEPPRPAGLDNYKVLFLYDDVFPTAVKNTLVFAVIAGPGGYILSFLLAWVINLVRSRFRMWFALACYAPSIAGGAVALIIWGPLFSPDRYGYLNNILLRIGLINEPIPWTIDPKYVLATLIITQLWMSMGTGFLVFLAGFQSMPTEVYDAAKVDGVESKWQELWLVTIPMMKPQMLFSAVMSVIGAFSAVGLVASPMYAAHTITSHMSDYAFVRYELGYASAIAVFLFVVMVGVNRILFTIFSTKDQY